MPRLSPEALCDLLRRLPADEMEEALRSRTLKAVSLPGVALHAACGPQAVRQARARGLGLVAYAATADFLAAVRAVHGARLLDRATSGLARRWPGFSARTPPTFAQTSLFILLVMCAATANLLLPLEAMLMLGSAASGVFFLAVIMLRLLCLLPPVRRPGRALPELTREQLPVYSVLVPLFREVAMLPQLMLALERLRYPRDKLDIKLILEDTDVIMQRAVAEIDLPPHIEVIVVPAGRPQTKPRALNYALPFCRGSLLTIYDAEDIPEATQLLKAARRFAVAPSWLACLQAQLTFYNAGENWLTRQFIAEYATLFGVLLPTLANHNLPLPLGGTSNHFRMEALHSVGAWDPYNVTEDADLGLRLARFGYATGVLDSFTHEEASSTLGVWMRQRARWLKGFLMTWLVHMREPTLFMRDLGPSGFWAAQVLTLGVFASVLLHPICMALTVALWLTSPPLPQDAGLGLVLLSAINFVVLLLGYGVSIIIARRALKARRMRGWPLTLAGLPLYWLLMSAAAWLALWQFFTRPFHWNKTQHGLTRAQPFRQRMSRDTG